MLKLVVLMSTYNGEKYLREQLNSLVTQDMMPDKILIRDDGSSDSTLEILKYYAENYDFIEYYQGKNLGPAKSFMELIKKAPTAKYYSLCDQDDVWFKDKLKVAVNKLNAEKSKEPLLYCSRFTLTDEKLNPLDSNISKLYSYTDFAHSLLFQTAPGCTFVFNNAARKLIVKYDMNKEYVIIHDSIIHKVVTMFGKMVLDPESHMYYRQHGNNEIGLSANEKKNNLERVKRLFTGKLKHYRKNTALSLLNVYGNECCEDKKKLLEIVAHYDENTKYRYKLMFLDCFKTHSIYDLYFKVLVLTRYI